MHATADNAARAGNRDFDPAGMLLGMSVLIVEDEAILALDLAATIREAGALVEGPLRRLEDAMAYWDLDGLDAAVLDVDIAGDQVFRFADRLVARGIPIVFHTGRVDISELAARYPQAQVIRKPCLSRGLVAALSAAINAGRVPRAAS